MYKKIALTLTLALAMFAGSTLSVQAAADGGGKKKKKECTSTEKTGCCASKTAGENGAATSTSANGGTNAKACTKGESKCCAKKATETK
jgi:hypothetical protein